jgi:hypothetical protein
MKAYLSIDLDYWSHSRNARRSCTDFFKRVWELKLPIYVAMFHHHLLPHINASGCDTCINVDYHSDLADLHADRVLNFNEGTWGNFVDWRLDGTFIWRFPLERCLHSSTGFCHQFLDPFLTQVSGWKVTERTLRLARMPWSNIKAIGVSVSPDWLGDLKALSEPLTRLQIRHWPRGYWKEEVWSETTSRMPKFVRVNSKH